MDHGASTRRRFLKQSAAAATLATTTPYWLTSSSRADDPPAKNDRIQLGIIGCGGIAMSVDGVQARAHGAEIVAVCDVDSNHAQRASNKFSGGKATKYNDHRKLLERDDIDAVLVATPDHWHTLPVIDAIKAGKDVYCEKPMTLTIEEGEIIQQVLAAHPDRIVQVGTQQRSQANLFIKAIALVQQGRLGEIKRLQCAIGGTPGTRPYNKTTPPANLDWDRWQGQTPAVDYIPQRLHKNFRWWYEYSGGKMTDWGAHHVDIAVWALGEQATAGPITISGTGKHPIPFKDGYPTVDNQFNTAQQFHITSKLASGVELVMRHDTDNGLTIEGTKGRIFVNRGKLVGKPVDELAENPLPEDALKQAYKGVEPYHGRNGHGNHWRHFFDCLRERREPISDVASHVLTLDFCHLANIALRLGEPISADDPTKVNCRELTWDPAKREIVGDEQAAGFVRREQRAGYEIKAS